MVKKLAAYMLLAGLAGLVGCGPNARGPGDGKNEVAAREGEQARADKAPLVEKYLLEGKLADGEKALQARLKEDPKDDQARFGLGVLQFLQAYEHLGANLYKYGLRTEKAFLRTPPQVKEFL